MIRTHRTSREQAFTLIELLVVISIIALLLSILLPSMVGARRTGQRVACMANLRSLASGAAEYATDNNDWIVGSPAGSGAYLLGSPLAYGPSVQTWDFMGPLAKMWGMSLTEPSLGDINGVVKRFDELRSSKAFLCPANKFLASRFSGPPNATVGWMVSYNTMRYQLLVEGSDGPIGVSHYPVTEGADGVVTGPHESTIPVGWKPNVGRIGSPSNKVFCADGSRFSTTTVAPDFDLSVHPGWGGAFSDLAPYGTFTRSWNRSWAPGNGSKTGVDARIYAFRHSTAEPAQGAAANAFRMNVAFYDGHVETQGDLESANPQQWEPQGAWLAPQGLYNDVVEHFQISGPMRIGP
ncbi:MAG: type II secretion system protein [Phycisphaerae bacterium]